MRKLKLFSLALMALFATQMWGADYTIYMATSSGVNTANVDKTEIKFTFNSMKAYSNSPVTTVADATYGIEAGLKAPRFGGSSEGNNIKIDVKSGYIATVTAYVQTNTANKAIAIKTTNAAPASTDLAYVNCAATETVYKIEATNLAAGTYYIKVSADKIGLIKLVTTVGPACSDPNTSIIDDAAGYVGDVIDLEYSSDNTSDIVWDIKKGGAATSDASISEGKFTATVAGTYVVTATQAADGTHCEAEESVTLTIVSADKVETVTINNAAETARLNEEVKLTMTAENATQYKWYVKKDAGEYAEVVTTAGYTFSATEAGSYTIKCAARNDFNKDGEQNPTWVESSNTHTITVTIGTDATLSALAVTGKTLTPDFDADEFSYSVGEIGVYEKLTITYTVNDAPYATAVLKNNIITDGADTVVVTAEDGETVNNYIINYTREAATELVSISESTTWDWTKTGESSDFKLTDATMPTRSEEFVFADLLSNTDESFKADAIAGILEYVYRKQGDYKFCQGNQLRFVTTVPGTVTVTYFNTGDRSKESDRRWLTINGEKIGSGTMKASEETTDSRVVSTGEVIIAGINASDIGTMLRFSKIVFTEAPKYDITCNDAEHGSVSAQAQAHEDDVVTLTATPAEGYILDAYDVYKTGEAETKVTVTDGKFTMPAYAVTVSATFKVDPATALDNTEANVKAVKRLENGMLVIEKNGVRYNAQGLIIR